MFANPTLLAQLVRGGRIGMRHRSQVRGPPLPISRGDYLGSVKALKNRGISLPVGFTKTDKQWLE